MGKKSPEQRKQAHQGFLARQAHPKKADATKLGWSAPENAH